MVLTLHDCDQRSNAWFNLRRKTAITGSSVHNVITCNTYSEVYQKMVAEKINGVSNSLSHVKAVDHGIICEPFAIARLKRDFGEILEVGFVTNSKYPNMGASPDGLIVDYMETGPVLLEIKCPYTRKLTGEIPIAYRNQMQFQMLICNVDRCLYVEAKFPQGTTTLVEPTEIHSKIVEADPSWYSKNKVKLLRFIDDVNYSFPKEGDSLIEMLQEVKGQRPKRAYNQTKVVCLLDF